MDVHKSFVYVCIPSTNEQGVTTYKSKRISTFTKDLRFLRQLTNFKDVCKESTGKYWIPICIFGSQLTTSFLLTSNTRQGNKGEENRPKTQMDRRYFLITILFRGTLSLLSIFVNFKT